MLPTFPEFKKLELNDKAVLEAVTSVMPPYSDFNFTSLFSWNVYDVAEVCSLNDNLVLRFTDYHTGEHFYTFIGTKDVDKTINTLMAYAEEKGVSKELLLVPQTTVSSISNSENLSIEEDHDNHDYILSVADLVAFRANKYRGKRNLLNRFVRYHGETAVSKELDLSDQEVLDAIDKVTQTWLQSRAKTLAVIEHEIKAIRRCISHARELNARGFGIYVKGELVAFTLFELLPGKIATLHFCKADTNYIGIYEHMNHSFAKHLTTLDVEHINIEQNMGVDGLRNSKQSYHPVHFLKKYKVSPKKV